MSRTFCRMERSDPRLDVIVASVGDQVLHKSAGERKSLYFVKNDQTLARMQRHAVVSAQIEKKLVEVGAQISEEVRNLVRDAGKVNEKVGAVVPFCKLLNQSAFSHSARALYQQSGGSLPSLFPFQKMPH